MKLFNQEQLQMICTQAELCLADKSGELSVVEAVRQANLESKLFSEEELVIIAFCAEAVRRQDEPDRPELKVYFMIVAYDLGYTQSLERQVPTQQDDYDIACIIEPDQNNDYRWVAAVFRNGTTGLAPELIHSAMRNLFSRGFQVLNAQESWEEYERIHPRLNGNGRNGVILYNRLNGTMLRPQFPAEPEDFKQPRDTSADAEFPE